MVVTVKQFSGEAQLSLRNRASTACIWLSSLCYPYEVVFFGLGYYALYPVHTDDSRVASASVVWIGYYVWLVRKSA